MANKTGIFNYETGLAVIRAQPFHNGHEFLIDTMCRECKTGIVLIGSKDAQPDERNPFGYDQRATMVRNAFPAAALLIDGINDLGNPKLWAEYVLVEIWKNFRMEPNAYFCGQGQDGGLFRIAGLKVVELSRNAVQVSGTEIRRRLSNGDASALNLVHPANREMIKNKLMKTI